MAPNGNTQSKTTRTTQTRTTQSRATTTNQSTNSASAGRSDSAKIREGLTKARNGSAAYARQTAERSVDVPFGAALTVAERVTAIVEPFTARPDREPGAEEHPDTGRARAEQVRASRRQRSSQDQDARASDA